MENNFNFEEAIKNLEKRWGLTLVSFLPANARGSIIRVQQEVANLWRDGDTSVRQSRHYISFYEPEQFHCTHLTLTRSDTGGPVRARSFIQEGHQLFELFKTIQGVTSQLTPIEVRLDRIMVAKDGLGIILLGECEGESSVIQRQNLLNELNQKLPPFLNLSSRSWDIDSSKFHKVHCALGYLKRQVPQGIERVTEYVKNISFEPISCSFTGVTLVHHKYRSLMFPQEGLVYFPFGKNIEMKDDEFSNCLNLSQE